MPASKGPIATHSYAGPRRSLMLAGGGMRLAYQAGVIKALQEEGLQFNHVDGTSGGIFNTAMLASGVPAEEMGQNWRKVSIKSFTSPSPVKSYFNPLKTMGYTDADGIREKVFPALGIDLPKINSNTNFLATFNVCNFTDKSTENIRDQKVKEDHLIAGVSLPIVMPALKIDGKWYSDSVWIKDTNLVEAVKLGAEEIWLVWAIGNCSEYLPGALNQYVHMIEMSANGGLLEEYAQIDLMLQARNSENSTSVKPKSIRYHVIKPLIPLPLDTDLYLNKIDIRTLINWGYSDAKRYLKNYTSSGIPFDLDATKMQSPGIRLSFRCTFESTLAFEGKKTGVCYYPAFCFQQIENRFEIIVIPATSTRMRRKFLYPVYRREEKDSSG